MDSVTVRASATSANLGAGFDVLGLALDSPYDLIEVEKADRLSIAVRGWGAGHVPLDPKKNTAGLVALELGQPVKITIESGIRPSSGLGSSAAPAAGAAVAIDKLFSLGHSKEELIAIAARGEVAAAGTAHADNVAPCILGDLAIVSEGRIAHVAMPPLAIVAVLPDIVISTRVARGILPSQVPLEEMVRNVGKASLLLAGVARGDPWLIGQSLAGSFNERYRSPLIKGHDAVCEAAISSGAYGAAISGSGPTMIALCPDGKAEAIAAAMRTAFQAAGVSSEAFITKVGKGVKILNAKHLQVGDL